MFYNPPGFRVDALLQLQNSLSSLPNTLPIVLCGDFNLPNINWSHSSPSPSATLLCDLLHDYNLQQVVLEPTRVSSILDLVFTNKVNGVCDVRVVDNLPGTDHDAVLFTTNFHKPRPLGQKRWTYTLSGLTSPDTESY